MTFLSSSSAINHDHRLASSSITNTFHHHHHQSTSSVFCHHLSASLITLHHHVPSFSIFEIMLLYLKFGWHFCPAGSPPAQQRPWPHKSNQEPTCKIIGMFVVCFDGFVYFGIFLDFIFLSMLRDLLFSTCFPIIPYLFCLHMLSDCSVKAPALRFVATSRIFVSEIFRHTPDLSCAIQTLEHVVQHNKALTSLKARKSKNKKKNDLVKFGRSLGISNCQDTN